MFTHSLALCTHGVHVVCHGAHIVCICGLPWCAHCVCMVCMLHTCGVHVVCMWCACCVHVVCICGVSCCAHCVQVVWRRANFWTHLTSLTVTQEMTLQPLSECGVVLRASFWICCVIWLWLKKKIFLKILILLWIYHFTSSTYYFSPLILLLNYMLYVVVLNIIYYSNIY